jgi:hypothetical protein
MLTELRILRRQNSFVITWATEPRVLEDLGGALNAPLAQGRRIGGIHDE